MKDGTGEKEIKIWESMICLKILVSVFKIEFLSDMWAFGGSKRTEYLCKAIHLYRMCEYAKKDCRS